MELHFDPVTDAAVFPLEGGDQRLLRQLEAEREFMSAGRKDGHFTIV